MKIKKYKYLSNGRYKVYFDDKDFDDLEKPKEKKIEKTIFFNLYLFYLFFFSYILSLFSQLTHISIFPL